MSCCDDDVDVDDDDDDDDDDDTLHLPSSLSLQPLSQCLPSTSWNKPSTP